MNEDIIKALSIIGNAKKVKEICEPNIFEHMELKKWMVRRTLMSLNLFDAEYKKWQDEIDKEKTAIRQIV